MKEKENSDTEKYIEKTKELKYIEEINKLPCDLDRFSGQEREAFRWTFEDINDPRNFQPRFLLKSNMPRDSCIGWGLSMFNTKQSAKSRLLKIAQNRKFIFKKLGTHVANGKLDTEDGISDKAHENGHFTLFEYKDVDLSQKFTVIEQIQ